MFKFKKKSFIEDLNHFLYDRRDRAYITIRSLMWFSSISAMALLLYLIGFEPEGESRVMALFGLTMVFAILIATFFVRWFYSFQRLKFIKERKFEAFLMFLMALQILEYISLKDQSLDRFLHSLGYNDAYEFYQIFAATYIFIFVGYRLTHLTVDLSHLPLRPSTIFMMSFIALISFGTFLLMLPAMTTHEGTMPFLEALFTSVSASCVTGLIVVDTATYFTFKGQVVILFLIQFGGLGIVSFASFFATFLGSRIGLKHQSMLQEMLSGESLFSTQGLLRRIVQITLLIEAIGFVLIYFTWGEEVHFNSKWDKIFSSLFHSVSAFCNAGFSLFTNNLYEAEIRNNYLLHVIVLVVVILGGIGFPAIRDLFSPARLRDRLERPWKDWQLSTKIAVYVSMALLFFGAGLLFFLEKDHSMKGLSFTELMVSSFFQSGVTRTAGFNTVDFGDFQLPSLLLCIFLMFIGASSGSVGGGIKTSTFYLILMAVVSTVKGRQKIEIGKRHIPHELLYKAFAIFVFAVIFNFSAIMLLSISEPEIDLIRLAFEQISAFATVGLSTGITADLSDWSRVIIILSMFLGRIGPLTVMLVLSSKVRTQSYSYPDAYMMIG